MKRKSLLFTLRPKDLRQLKLERKLRDHGFSFKYIIDTYDLVNYSFPFGIRNSDIGNTKFNFDKEGNIETVDTQLIADSQVALNYIIEKREDTEVILPKEYNSEIKRLLKALKTKAKKYPIASDLLDAFKREIRNNANVKDFIKNNLSIITTIAIGSSDIGFNRFVKNFKDGHVLFESDHDIDWTANDNVDLRNRIFDIFRKEINSRGQHFYIEEYQQYLRKKKNKNFTIKNFFTFIQEAKKQAEENAFNDARLIAKIAAYNKGVIEKGQGCIYLYISSTHISRHVFRLIDKYLPRYEKEIFDFHRSEAQLFADVCLRNLDGSGIILDDFIQLLADNQTLSEHDFKNKHQFDNFLEGIRNSIENLALLTSLSIFIKDLEIASSEEDIDQNLKNASMANVLEYIQKMDYDFTLVFRELNGLMSELSLYDRLRKFLSQEPKTFIERNFGQDPIESIKQQLPVVFDYDSFNKYPETLDVLRNLSVFYTNNSPSKVEIVAINNLLLDFFFQEEDAIDRKVVQFMVYLTLPISLDEQKKKPNEFIYEEIDKFIERCELILGESKYHELRQTLLKELIYVQIWAARRAKRYKLSLEKALDYQKEFPNDPRFYHGECLVRYSQEFEKFFNGKQLDKKNLDSCLKSGERALMHYHLLNNVQDNIESRSSIEVLHNTLLFTYSIASYVEYRSNGDNPRVHAFLGIASSHLRRLKEWSSLYDNYYKYPEYIASESYYHWARSICFKEKDAKSKALELYQEANAMTKQNNRKVATAYDFLAEQLTESSYTTSSKSST